MNQTGINNKDNIEHIKYIEYIEAIKHIEHIEANKNNNDNKNNNIVLTNNQMLMQRIKEYAVIKSKLNTKMNLNEFFHDVRAQFYPNRDISFMNYFLDLCDQSGKFYVQHDDLFEYGIITTKKSSDIHRLLVTYLNLTEGEDFCLLPFKEEQTKRKGRGGNNKKTYMLTPEAFKNSLLSSRNEKKYRLYYLLLENVYKYYTDYQIMFDKNQSEKQAEEFKKTINEKDKTINEKDSSIQSLENKINKLIDLATEQGVILKDTKYQNNKLLSDIHDMNNEIKDANNKLDDANNKLDDANNEIQNVNNTLTRALDHLEDKSLHSTLDPKDKKKIHHFLITKREIIKNGESNQKVKFITGQLDYIEKNITASQQDKNTEVVGPFYTANGIDLRNNAFDEFKNRMKTYKINYNKIIQRNRADNKKLKTKITKQFKDSKSLTEIDEIYNSHPAKKDEATIKDSDITVKYSKTGFEYIQNKYISYDEVFKIILEVNDLTQTPPSV